MGFLSFRICGPRPRQAVRAGWLAGAALTLGATVWPAMVSAQIRTDSSLGRAATTLNGPNFLIPESLGKLAGRNLFHSFQTFHVQTGEAAHFTTSTPGLANVISRVTGGGPSTINGSVSLSAAGSGAPAFFFINPAGVTFGAGASVDVPGAFHVSTANHLQFADGRFSADRAATSTFSSAAPEAFGFLGTSRAPIKVTDNAALITQQGRALSVVGGDVQIASGGLVGKFGGAGELRVIAVGGDAATVPLAGALPAAARGTLAISGATSGIRSVTQGRDATASDAVVVAAGDILLTQQGSITSYTTGDSKAADLSVTASGSLSVLQGSLISASTAANGEAGAVVVRAADIAVLGQGVAPSEISSAALSRSGGKAGNVDVAATGRLSVVHGSIASSTASSADGGQVTVKAHDITLDGGGRSDGVSGISSATFVTSTGSAGRIDVTAVGELRVLNGASIDSSTYSAGNAGAVRVNAGNILVDGQGAGYAAISSLASVSSTGRGGTVAVTSAGDITLRNGGQFDSSTYATGNAGGVQVRAATMTMENLGKGSALSAVSSVSAPSAGGNAGNIDVNVSGALQIIGRSSIDSSVYTDGDGGSIRVQAGSIVIDPRALAAGGIRSLTWAPTGRKSGNIEVTTPGSLTVLDGGVIDSSTAAGADAGSVKVSAGSLTINGRGDQDRLTGIFSAALFDSTGHGGSIDVNVADKLTILGRGEIDSTTYALGNAGSVRVRVGSILIDDQGQGGFLTGIFSEATSSSSGHAGTVDVQATGLLTLTNGGLIDSNTYSIGNAGSVKVHAGSILIDGAANGYSAISSVAAPNSSGNAGNVEVTASGAVSVLRGGRIETAAYASGSAGTVQVSAATVQVDDAGSSINASAKTGSQGQTGSVVVRASERIALRNGGRLAIQNDAVLHNGTQVVPGTLIATAPVIEIGQDARITAQATGNAPASNIEVRASERLVVDHGSITTSAKDGNGGAIRILGSGAVALRHAQVTTSVTGVTGNGGDIEVHADTLALDRGFIQANTAASRASGGDVRIDVGTLLSSGNNLRVGGNTPYVFDLSSSGFSVIQAAAPTGVSGAIEVSSPVLDISGSLAALTTQLLLGGELARSPCQGGRSSLTQSGRGGFAPSAREFLGPERGATPARGEAASTIHALAPRGAQAGCVR
jgi:filamentous hemagglutinin family protein